MNILEEVTGSKCFQLVFVMGMTDQDSDETIFYQIAKTWANLHSGKRSVSIYIYILVDLHI